MTKSKDLSPELQYVGEIDSHAVYEIIPRQPATTDEKLGSAASRRCFDPRALRDIVTEEPTTEAPEEPPINEVEAMARLYKNFGVTATSMTSSPVENEIYDVTKYGFLSND